MTLLPRSSLTRLSLDRTTARLFLVALACLAVAWWTRETSVSFNRFPLWLGTAILGANVAITLLVGRRAPLIGYILAGAALSAELFLLILLGMAQQGRIL